MDLYELGYTDQLAMNFSDVVIQQMSSKHPNIQWRVEDVRDLKLEDASFDMAVDKVCFCTFGSSNAIC